jgi:hypothetical protein
MTSLTLEGRVCMFFGWKLCGFKSSFDVGKKVKISLLQAVEAHRIARG